MTEVYNMTQAQRDAAHIAALEKQVADLSEVVKALACSRTHLDIRIMATEIDQAPSIKELMQQYAQQAAADAGSFILGQLRDRGALYEKLAQYEQWFYTKANYTTRFDALRSTMTTAK